MKTEEIYNTLYDYIKNKIKKNSVRNLNEKQLDRLVKSEIAGIKDIKEVFNNVKGYKDEKDDRRINWIDNQFCEAYSNNDLIEGTVEITGVPRYLVSRFFYDNLENLKRFKPASAVKLLSDEIEQTLKVKYVIKKVSCEINNADEICTGCVVNGDYGAAPTPLEVFLDADEAKESLKKYESDVCKFNSKLYKVTEYFIDEIYINKDNEVLSNDLYDVTDIKINIEDKDGKVLETFNNMPEAKRKLRCLEEEHEDVEFEIGFNQDKNVDCLKRTGR